MYGIYSWKAGAAAPQIVADLLAMASGTTDVNTLSASCETAQTTIAGAVPGWTALDAPYGVIAAPGIAGGPGMQLRITISGAPRIQLQPVDQWSLGTHAPAFAGSAQDCSLATNIAGAVNLIVTPECCLLGSSDWSVWSLSAEVKRDGPVLTGDAPGNLTYNQQQQCSMPRVKQPAGIGDASSPQLTLQSAYGALSAVAVRNRAEALYFPMVSAITFYQQVPVGEVKGVVAVGGYAASGDYIVDADNATWRAVKNSYGQILAVKRV